MKFWAKSFNGFWKMCFRYFIKVLKGIMPSEDILIIVHYCHTWGLHGIQFDLLGKALTRRLGHRVTCSTIVSTASLYQSYNTLNKNMRGMELGEEERVRREIAKKCQNRHSKPKQQNLTHFGWYLMTQCIIFKTNFCVEIVSPSLSIWIPWSL